ncbi:hypothetical protein ABIA31_007140 [Catenulispora sp. MAP5-51]|uniref:hypothetical protein n=1 Tax=Catenulispora sp. MAP5-51 TaxID=3156298 RepID=UPI003514A25D
MIPAAWPTAAATTGRPRAGRPATAQARNIRTLMAAVRTLSPSRITATWSTPASAIRRGVAGASIAMAAARQIIRQYP